jgi:hypothetical protein
MVRAPETLQEKLLANFRPQPAIPAVLVCMLAYTFAIVSGAQGVAAGGISFTSVLVAVGVAASCGLAIAAGFCSLFPQVVWLLLAVWGLRLTAAGTLHWINRYVLLSGIVAVVVMFFVQVWRVRTGRFVPTISISAGEDYD